MLERPAFSPRWPTALCLAALLASCAGPSRAPTTGEEAVRLTIVATNDLHGWIEPQKRPVADGEPLLGGADVFDAYLGVLRRQRPGEVVLLDAGDMFQGTLVANMTEGAAVIRAYNLLGYDAVALGNHEFDYGPEGEPVVALTPGEDPLGNVKRRIAEARFPVLAGNVVERATGRPPEWRNLHQVVMLERRRVRVGIVGLITPSTPAVTLAQNVAALEFRELLPAAAELAGELRRRGAQVVILALHAGGGCESLEDPRDTSSCRRDSELFELLEQLPPGTVDAAVAGHTHQKLAHFINGVPAIQSFAFGVAFGAIDLHVEKHSGRVLHERTKIWKPVPLCRKVFAVSGDCREGSGPVKPARFLGEEIVTGDRITAALADDFRLVRTRREELLGPRLETPFRRSRTEQSPLGSLVADVMRSTVPGAHAAVTNSGGLRADVGPGRITYGDVFNALPFENRLATLELTGAELLDFLEEGVSGRHGIVQVSGIVLDVVDPAAPACATRNRRLLGARLADGTPIAARGRYLVVTNDFVAGGGDSFDAVLSQVSSDRIRVRNDLPALREVVVTHFRAHPSLAGPRPEPAPRIRFVRPDCARAEAR